MGRPAWASSTTARRWLAGAAILLVLLAGRVSLRSFGAEAVLSDGAKAKASCKAPWRSAVAGPPHQRFTLWVMSGGTGQRREEGVDTLGARCRTRARIRVGFAVSLLTIGALCTGLAIPARPRAPRLEDP